VGRGPRVALFGFDAFTDRPFGGNPAMVCLLPGPVGDGWMQRAAAELNQPATAFLHDRRLRWFTPAVELPMCGHATLATAHVLYEAGLLARPIRSFSRPSRVRFAHGARTDWSGSSSLQ
jgi:PhzF family phenazine biosynthesis protein